ncbi:hypothetical protein [Streptomyces sp. NBC_00557]|uniref:hypothetical protein n=1 Tax=Streptomyces sp. NBC_00557 TaxID=2975776 RepID=UPI002E8010F9|nr:hypothetical protein [Streptomyces sp. NBC_00557]WUC39392.1 hypothetical protein OG956_36900 [Streptomyces sp. NBC_00557]
MAVSFWALLFVIRSVNLDFFGFDRLRRPLREAVITASTAVFAVGVAYAFAVGFGHLNVRFHGLPGKVLSATSPPPSGMKQPLIGLCEIAFLMLPTVILYAVLGLPAVSPYSIILLPNLRPARCCTNRW